MGQTPVGLPGHAGCFAGLRIADARRAASGPTVAGEHGVARKDIPADAGLPVAR
ncbi:hypothetical protein GCM10010116_40210 [Microbispora rosea subsp. aerata]|nr:hypothetical protein GCM10010116_40210 [Microbispora rosea subsp. aerata]GIH57066.1 hypothetical protein Mro02_39800 [Microbispora rosea subsp. aerata]GLJ83523.1 hypothetical protein GCM10017588_22510 [Microbispora rosea subsp. aerata]